ncbi:hypothetical protein [Amycolatopsis anabasis]|uniref:hypothetical protein n=1 Tax=Amycolatopsis anabasis TaxID=1840409 RepID=UPI00131C8B48|nr:hypothetical protein [Amycolatopsis anabasis]
MAIARGKLALGVAVTAAAVSALTLSASAAAAQPSGRWGTVVPGCEQGCERAFSVSLPDNGRLEGLRAKDADGFPVSYLAYWSGPMLRASTQVRDVRQGWTYEWVDAAACGPDGEAQRCSVSFGTGAHSGAVASVRVGPRDGIVVTDTVLGSAPNTGVADLNGDGRPDAAIKESTYEPSYADGPQYWQTFVQRDGKFTRTGCTAPSMEAQPVPAAPVSGECPR